MTPRASTRTSLEGDSQLKTHDEVSEDKLRGGFYTPPRLVAHAVERLCQLVGSRADLRVLEPSIGDGGFIHGLASAPLDISQLVGVEILACEAAKAATRLASSLIPGRVVNASTLRWALQSTEAPFDAVVGNLPFVRFQFVSNKDRESAARHAVELGVSIAGVSNLWLPMLLASLRLLRPGGAFVLILPAECLTGVSAGSARQWLLENATELRCDLYPAGSFPGALQEVLLLSGRLGEQVRTRSSLTVALHAKLHSAVGFRDSAAHVTSNLTTPGPRSWTRFLLAPSHIDALAEFESLSAVNVLGDLAKFDVATVTGANAFFSLTASEVRQYALEDSVRPLLPRTRYAPGLIFNEYDFEYLVTGGASSYLFDASLGTPNRSRQAGLNEFLTLGEQENLHKRFKCRIRSPWWAVPGIRRGDLFLSKRCHRYPRMIVNETAAITTDTIYRGSIKHAGLDGRTLVAGFHNSGTLLSAELEGRTFGGGVLELVPSEVSRLRVPIVGKLIEEFERLDLIARETSQLRGGDIDDVLRHETDLLIRKAGIGATTRMLDTLSGARELLLSRRLDRGDADRTVQA